MHLSVQEMFVPLFPILNRQRSRLGQREPNRPIIGMIWSIFAFGGWNQTNDHFFLRILITPVKRSLLTRSHHQRVSFDRFLRNYKGLTRVVYKEIQGLYRGYLCIYGLICTCLMQICKIPKFQQFVPLNKLELVSWPSQIDLYFVGDVWRTLNFCVNLLCCSQNLYLICLDRLLRSVRWLFATTWSLLSLKHYLLLYWRSF